MYIAPGQWQTTPLNHDISKNTNLLFSFGSYYKFLQIDVFVKVSPLTAKATMFALTVK